MADFNSDTLDFNAEIVVSFRCRYALWARRICVRRRCDEVQLLLFQNLMLVNLALCEGVICALRYCRRVSVYATTKIVLWK